jgi:hypothetical protein
VIAAAPNASDVLERHQAVVLLAWVLVRDEEAAGSNPATPMADDPNLDLPVRQRDCADGRVALHA